MKTKNRNSNFELLRILAMLFIVFHHSVYHGLLNNSISLGGNIPFPSQVWLTVFIGQLVAMFGKVSVAVFVMISGYFLVNSSATGKKSLKKVLFLTAQIYFYSLIIYFIAAHFKWINPKDVGIIQQAFFPLFYNTNWFATEYILLYLIYPYLNILLHNISRHQYRNLILILTITFTVIPTFIPSFQQGESLVVFVLYYIIGGYIRLYNINNEKKLGILVTIGNVILLASVVFYHDYMGKISHNQQYYLKSFSIAENYTFVIVLIAMGIIMFFKYIDLGRNRVINTIAATTFGIYLIHDNPIMEQVIWLKWLNMPALLTSGVRHFLLADIIICPLIFIICSVIDFVRIKIFNGIGYIFKKLNSIRN